jgi:large subunit ribosomal protein L5e
MPFIKVLKSNTYCSRYQTKYRRRREGKTDYFARRRLVFQDKNKYDTKKYRFVVRRTNKRIICSVNFATIAGDHTMCMADSRELSRYGATAGHTNYAAAYATGLLLARRLLTQLKLADTYKGNDKIDGKPFNVFDSFKEGKRPMKANLDVGLVRTTTGNRVFGAMKGATDGGLQIPHSEQRFPGFKVIKAEEVTNKRGKKVEAENTEKKTEFDPKVHKDHIFGQHVQNYYDLLKKGDQNAFKRQFSQWSKCLDAAKVKDMPALWTKVHAAIRANPARVSSKNAKPSRKEVQKAPDQVWQNSKGKKWLRQQKTPSAVKRQRLAKVIEAVNKRYKK